MDGEKEKERERGVTSPAEVHPQRFEQSHILNYGMYMKTMPHGAADKDTANSQRCCHFLLKKGNPQGYMVTQTVATLAGFSRYDFLTHASLGCLQGCQSFQGNAWPQTHDGM